MGCMLGILSVGPPHIHLVPYIEEACRHLKLKTLDSRRIMLSLCQVYKIVHNLDCIPFNSYFTYFTFNTNCTRSHRLSLVCPLARINSFRHSFFINVPYLWNRIPFEVLNCETYPCFKMSLYHYL